MARKMSGKIRAGQNERENSNKGLQTNSKLKARETPKQWLTLSE